MINLVDHASNFCRVFVARKKDLAAKMFEHFRLSSSAHLIARCTSSERTAVMNIETLSCFARQLGWSDKWAQLAIKPPIGWMVRSLVSLMSWFFKAPSRLIATQKRNLGNRATSSGDNCWKAKRNQRIQCLSTARTIDHNDTKSPTCWTHDHWRKVAIIGKDSFTGRTPIWIKLWKNGRKMRNRRSALYLPRARPSAGHASTKKMSRRSYQWTMLVLAWIIKWNAHE